MAGAVRRARGLETLQGRGATGALPGGARSRLLVCYVTVALVTGRWRAMPKGKGGERLVRMVTRTQMCSTFGFNLKHYFFPCCLKS